MVLSTAALCLAANIYFEARNQPVDGQFAVAYVTTNRSNLKDSHVCDEVFKPKQFSWTSDRSVIKVATRTIKPKAFPANIVDGKAFNRALKIANIVLDSQSLFKDVSRGATMYHHVSILPFWAKSDKFKLVARIGDHLFYVKSNQTYVTDNTHKSSNVVLASL